VAYHLAASTSWQACRHQPASAGNISAPAIGEKEAAYGQKRNNNDGGGEISAMTSASNAVAKA